MSGELAPASVRFLEAPAEVVVPETLEGAQVVLDGVGGALSAGHWGTAAIVYAWTEPGSNQWRVPDDFSSGTLPLADFAKLRIRGLTTRDSVRKYRRAWEYAIEEGWAEPAEPGREVTLPTQPWKEATTAERLVASDENEWYTPIEYIEAARKVLGAIDLDPASSSRANKIVGAKDYYTQADDGLSRPWKGRVWLNPPYGKLAGGFIDRLVVEFAAAEVTAAIALVNAHCTDTRWFQSLWDYALCFTDHRIDFDSAGREKDTTSTHGSVFAYLGPKPDVFAAEFAQFGAVVRRWP